MTKNHKNSTYYLLRDILLNCFSDNSKNGLASTLNHHLISKEAISYILKDEVKEKKPNYRILQSSLIVLSNYLRIFPNSAYYDVVEILPELKYCFYKDKRITVKKLGAQTILFLFASIYFEVVIMSFGKRDNEVYVEKFKNIFSRNDLEKVIKMTDFHTRYIFERQGVDIGFGVEKDDKLREILDKFYSF